MIYTITPGNLGGGNVFDLSETIVVAISRKIVVKVRVLRVKCAVCLCSILQTSCMTQNCSLVPHILQLLTAGSYGYVSCPPAANALRDVSQPVCL